MATKKDLVIAILASFCLAATLFLIIPTRSSSSSYDPWLDVNGDGTINILDIAQEAKAFGSSGDPAKDVIVVNRTKTIEKDLNISIVDQNTSDTYYYGYGQASTGVFGTEGYDRMFVSMALIDISRYEAPINYTAADVSLQRVEWCWKMINGTYLTTWDNPPNAGSNRTLEAYAYDPNYLPVSGQTSEFTIKAEQCRLWFYASKYFKQGSRAWVLIHVLIYLTAGTTSPPSVQDTSVVNWPYVQPQPSSNTQWYDFNSPINNGYGWNSTGVYVGGYSRMFVSIEIQNASYYGVPVQTTVSLSSIYWNWNAAGSYENVSPSILNVTYYGTYLPVYSQQVPPEFKTKNSYCTLYFNVNSGASSGWVEFSVSIYLRNE